MSVKLGVVPACLYMSNSPMMFLSNRGSFRPETSGAYTLRRRGRRRPKSGSAIGACAVARLAGSGGPIGDYYGSANRCSPRSRQPRSRCGDWVYGRKVNLDFHVVYGTNRYSAPYRLVGKKVDLKVTESTVEIYHGGERGRHAPAHPGTSCAPTSCRPTGPTCRRSSPI